MAPTLLWLTYSLLNLFYDVYSEEQQFLRFIETYSKSYSPGSHEYWKRFEIFQQALKKIEYLNSQRSHPDSAYFGLTPFADMTLEEFKQTVIKPARTRRTRKAKQLRLRSTGLESKKWNVTDLPKSIDWRVKGIIGDVIAQGKCGSCWAHTVVDTLSSMVSLQTKSPYVKLSAQQLLDCSTSNYGCEGGDLCLTLIWMVNNKVRILTESEYPLRQDSGSCRYPNPKLGIQIHSNFTCHKSTGREENMIKLLANHGPIMAAADASFWQYYVNGTIHDHCGKDANHAVQIVGYNLTANIPYYIVRNTWGTNWGMDGYLHVAIGKNTCAITEEVAAVWIK